MPRTTLHVLAASASPFALVLRRGPSKWWHFLLWNRDTGMIEPGSWFHGMVYPGQCDLSPRGDYFLLLALRGCGSPPAWTALCRPPYVRALAFWPQESARTGGGYFDERLPVAWLNIPADTVVPEVSERTALEFGYQEEPDQYFGLLAERFRRAGWKPNEKQEAGRWALPSPDGKWELVLQLAGTALPDPTAPGHENAGAYALRRRGSTARPLILPEVEWAGWNGKSQLCLAKGGTLQTAPPARASEPVMTLDLRALRPGNGRTLARRPPRTGASAP